MARGRGRAHRAIISGKEKRSLEKKSKDIERAAEARIAALERSGSKRGGYQGLGSLLGLGAAFLAPWSLPWWGTGLLMGGGSWLGGEIGEEVYDYRHGDPYTGIDETVPKGMFFGGERDILKEGITDIEEDLSDAWSSLLEGMDEKQLSDAISSGITFGALKGGDQLWSKILGTTKSGVEGMKMGEKLNFLNLFMKK